MYTEPDPTSSAFVPKQWKVPFFLTLKAYAYNELNNLQNNFSITVFNAIKYCDTKYVMGNQKRNNVIRNQICEEKSNMSTPIYINNRDDRRCNKNVGWNMREKEKKSFRYGKLFYIFFFAGYYYFLLANYCKILSFPYFRESHKA